MILGVTVAVVFVRFKRSFTSRIAYRDDVQKLPMEQVIRVETQLEPAGAALTMKIFAGSRLTPLLPDALRRCADATDE